MIPYLERENKHLYKKKKKKSKSALLQCVSQIMASKDIQILISGTCQSHFIQQRQPLGYD